MDLWSTNKIRKAWLDYFVSNNHLIIPPHSLIPKNDPSILWINSGVATLKKYFSGLASPPCKRLVNCQKAIRTNDISNVGLTSRHHTFFEMLGNFSIGDYFKKDAIDLAFNLLKNIFLLNINNLYFTVFEDDSETYELWIKKGIKPNHIFKCNKNRNFWDLGSGPCGPCTEIFYDRGEKFDFSKQGIKLLQDDIENDRYVEIWNIVFSQFNNVGNGKYTELTQKNIDTGAGLERLACILQNKNTDYETDIFFPVIKVLEKYTKHPYVAEAYFSNNKKQKNINKNFSIIADHLRAIIFAIADGALPSSKERGAVIRKLIRRMLIAAKSLDLNNSFLKESISASISTMSEFYGYLLKKEDEIYKILISERELFSKTLNHGFDLFKSIISKNKIIDPEMAFKLVETYGFPYEILIDICAEKNINFDKDKYETLFKKHKLISRNEAFVNAKGMEEQNSLINFKVQSFFNYEKFDILNSKIIQLFDSNFEPVENFKGLGYIVVHETPFFATCGGQEHDVGYVVINKKKVNVIDVIKSVNGQHLHKVETDFVININDSIDLYVDKMNRKLLASNHSCEHLIQKALQAVISNEIIQESSNKTADHLSFQFSYKNKLTTEQIINVENEVNKYIKTNAKVTTKLMSLDEAKAFGAQAHFDDVYSKINGPLRVVIMEGITSEICAGTHVKYLGEIEQFLISKIETKRAGEYRLIGLTTNKIINSYLTNFFDNLKSKILMQKSELKKRKISDLTYDNIVSKLSFSLSRENYHIVSSICKEVDEAFNELIKKDDIKNSLLLSNKIINEFNITKSTIVYAIFDGLSVKNISNALSKLVNANKDKCFVAFNKNKNKIQYLVCTGSNVKNEKYYALNIVREFNKISNGTGGGNNFFAQGGSLKLSSLSEIINLLSKSFIECQ